MNHETQSILEVSARLSKSDDVLARLISTLPEPKTESTHDVFFDLMSCVLEQQIHYRSSKKIFQKMLVTAELETLTPDNFHLLEERAFPFIKLAPNKIETAYRIVDFWDENDVDWERLTDDEVRRIISSIKGVGSWSIDMILLFTLERPDIFPADDFHLKQVMTDLYDLDATAKLKAQMLRISEMWGNNRSIAVKYILGWKEFVKNGKR